MPIFYLIIFIIISSRDISGSGLTLVRVLRVFVVVGVVTGVIVR